MLGVGFWEIVIIALVCFIVFGADELPKIMRKLAQFYKQASSLKEELRFQILSADEEPSKPKKEFTPQPELNAAQSEVLVVPRDQHHG